MTDKMFILKGATGNYDDYRQWDVCASHNKELLEYHKIQCEKERDRVINKIHELKEPPFNYELLVSINKLEAHKLDEHFSCEDSVTVYHIKEVKILGEVKDERTVS